MNWIEKMIAEQCPNGVERVKLPKISVNQDKKRKPITSSKRVKGNTPYYGASGVVDYVEGYIFDGDYLLISEDGANLIMRSTPIAFGISGKTWVNNHAHVLEFSHKCTQRFVEYYLNSIDLTPWIAGGAQPKLNQENLNKIEIPLPPLSIQEEIVNVLDKFTELIEKTDEETELRQKQYEYYREKLLTFEEGEVEWKTLPEISINQDKKRKPITGSKRVHGDYPYYGASGIVDYVEGYIFDGDYLLISEDGANLIMRSTPIAFGISGKNWVNNHAHVIEFQQRCTQRLVEVYLNSIDLAPWISGGAQPKLNQENLNKIPIPVPSPSRQQEIVATLDKFEALIASLKEERELRQKQYEYYREKLLTF